MLNLLCVLLPAVSAALFVQVLLEYMDRSRARARLRQNAAVVLGRLDLRAEIERLADNLEQALENRLPFHLKARLAKGLENAGFEGWTPGKLVLAQAGSFLAAFALSWAILDLGALSLAPALGFFCLPLVALRDGVLRRQAALRKALPDALDLLTSCVEAGLSFDLALARVAQRLKAGPLRRELELALSQMRLGQTRREALKALAARVDLDDLSALVSSLVQADQMGVPLGPALRAQSGQLRALRSLRVQKQAAQAPIKMLFPLMVFILPVVFLVLFGPIFIKWNSGAF
jgi:tight adherence protein C